MHHHIIVSYAASTKHIRFKVRYLATRVNGLNVAEKTKAALLPYSWLVVFSTPF